MNRTKKSITLSVTFSFIALNSLYAVDNNTAQQSIIDTIKNRHSTIRNIKAVEINGEKVIINRDGARVMVRLKTGVSPTEAYEGLFNNAKISKTDIEYVKSFPLKEARVSALKEDGTINDSQTKHILVLKSKTLSDEELLEIAKQINGVEIAEISPPVSINSQSFPNDDLFSKLWGMHNDGTYGKIDADIDAPEAWSKNIGNKIPVIGIIDTGVDYTHPDLKNNIWINEKEFYGKKGVDDDGNGYIDDIFGIDTYNQDSDPIDDNGHGTHIAGTIAGEGNNAIGVAGVNWNSRVASCKFLDSDGYGSLDDAVECINYFNTLKSNGVNIVVTNNSWGGGDYSEILEDAIEEANALGILFVAAAGNEENNNDINPVYPANYQVANVISVAATDSNDELASFSNFGQNSVHLGAPGENITSTLPTTNICRQNGNLVLFSDNFESGDGNWSMLTVDPDEPLQDLVNEHWKIDNSIAYSGVNSLSDSNDSNYTDNRIQTVMMKYSIDLSNRDENETLCASIKIKGEVEENYDYLQFMASSDGGENWVYLGDKISGEIAEWTEIGVPIPSDMFSSNFKLAIVRYSDCCINFEGYNIDDVTIGSGDINQIANYGALSGTSMAAPHVTGAIAFLSSLEDTLSPLDIKEKILDSVDTIDSLNGTVSTGGRLNINSLIASYIKPDGLIDFDDINTSNDDDGYDYLTKITEYAGLKWTNFNVIDVQLEKDLFGENGYYNGMISSRNVAYNEWGNDANISSSTPFNFKSAYLTGAWEQDLNVTVKGYKEGTLKYTKSIIISIYHPTKVNFDFNDVDTITFHAEGGIEGPYQIKTDADKQSSFMAEASTSDVSTLSSGNHFVIDNIIIEQIDKDRQDINGDSFDDILVYNTSNGRVSGWFGSPSADVSYKHLISLSSDVKTIGVFDLNGDHFNDIIIQNTSNGRVGVWFGEPSGDVSYKYLFALSSDSQIVDTLDLNGDNFDDILVQNTSNGRVGIWFGSPSGDVSYKYLFTLSSDSQIIDTLNLNGDNFDDILVQNTSNGRIGIWFGSLSGDVSYRYLTTLSSDSQIIDTLNLNGDNFDDILVQNTSNGNIGIWFGSLSGDISYKYLFTLSSDIQIANTLDLNGDGFGDILVQNTSNGRVSAWFGSLSGDVSYKYLFTLSSDIQIADILNINGDSFDDIIVHNSSNGRVSAWLGSPSGDVSYKYLMSLSLDIRVLDFD